MFKVVTAYKANKDSAIELLQEEVRSRHFKCKKNSIFTEEALYTVFARNERDELTRIIDDSLYHPDMVDAIIYALRDVWRSKSM